MLISYVASSDDTSKSLGGFSPEDSRARAGRSRRREVRGPHRFAAHLSVVTVRARPSSRAGISRMADKLSVFARVDVGSGELTDDRVRPPERGGRPRVAVPTAATRRCPATFKIKKPKIRGVESQGMTCSFREASRSARSTTASGSSRVSASAWGRKVGASASRIEDWGARDRTTSHFTPRPDCLGHRGSRAKVAALFDRELLPLPPTEDGRATGGRARLSPVRIESKRLVRATSRSRSTAALAVADPPEWLAACSCSRSVSGPYDQRRRHSSNLRDASTFGQPTNVFDQQRLDLPHPPALEVRTARARRDDPDARRQREPRADPRPNLLICSGGAPVASSRA
jgi:phenylalanyl-tRNA synthetase beta chain